MAAAIWGTTAGAGGIQVDWDTNASLLDSCYNGAAWSNGLLTFTRVDGTNDAITFAFVPDFVVTGILLSLQTAPSALDIGYTAGTAQIDGVPVVVGVGGTVTVNAGDPTNPRIDLIYVDNAGTVDKVTGTAATSPTPPSTPANSLALAYVYVDANATAGTGGTTLQALSFLKNNVFQGTADYQTLRFSASQDAYVPNNALQSDGATVGVNTVPGTEALTIDGAIEFSDISAPGTTTNKLYSVSGNIFYDGVQLNTGTTIAAGTTARSILTWSGAAWTEDVTTLISASAAELDAKHIGIDNIATPAAPSTGVRLFAQTNSLFAITPLGTFNLTGNGVLPAGTLGYTLAFQGGLWVASDRIRNNGVNSLGFAATSGSNSVSYNQSVGSAVIAEATSDGTNTITRQISTTQDSLTKLGGSVTGGIGHDWSTGSFDHSLAVSGTFLYARTINGVSLVSSQQFSDSGTNSLIITEDVGATPEYDLTITNGTATAILNLDLATSATLSFDDGSNTSSVECDGTNVNVTGNLVANNGVYVASAGGYVGTSVLVGGTVTVANTNVTANSVILLTSQVDGGTTGSLRISARNAGVNFTITSSSGADTSTIGWLIIETV